MPAYARPARLADALGVLAAGRPVILAGGTDVYAAPRRAQADVLDIGGIAALRGIRKTAQGWSIGATATWSELLAARLPPMFDALKLAAREIGGEQVQNAGTLAGNVCNASPAADGMPALLALDASVELSGPQGVRVLPLAEFVLGPRKTARRADELLTAILVPKAAHPATSSFRKLGARKYLLISIAVVAVVLESRNSVIQSARIAVGACSPVAQRLIALERELAGKTLDASIADAATPAHLAALAPIDDVRATAAYRRDAALELVRRSLRDLA
jgi:CO/xanthine dehydrogenase FAD-binding subunit